MNEENNQLPPDILEFVKKRGIEVLQELYGIDPTLPDFIKLQKLKEICKERGIDQLKRLHGIPDEEELPLDNQGVPILDKRIQKIENPRMRTLLNQRAWSRVNPFEPIDGFAYQIDKLKESERSNESSQTEDS